VSDVTLLDTVHDGQLVRVPLSPNQEYVTVLGGDGDTGPRGARHDIAFGWRIRGRVSPAVLRQALHSLVCRHEALRTTVVSGAEGHHQEIWPPSPPALEVIDIGAADPVTRDRLAEDLLVRSESSDRGIDGPPLRALLARFGQRDAVLVLIVHHAVVDDWSTHVLGHDLAACYAAHASADTVDLPAARRQPRDGLAWEREQSHGDAAARARDYWRDTLRGADTLAFRTDWPKSEGHERTTAAHRFPVGAEVASGVAELARQTGTSVSVVLVAAYQAFLRHMTDMTDIVVPVLAADRRPARLRDTVGSLVDLTALRTDVAGCETFRRQVLRTRASALAAYRHQLPYAEVLGECPHVGRAYTEDDRAVFTFGVSGSPYAMRGRRVGGLEYTAIRRLRSQEVGPDVPDGALWTLDVDPAGELTGCVRYATGLFARATVEELAAEFGQVLARTVTAPDARVR
jgi:hypothetical protein